MSPLRLTRQDLDAIAAAGGDGRLPQGFHIVIVMGLFSLAAFGWVLL